MRHDDLDTLLQDTLKAEVATSAERLIALEERVIMTLGERRPRLRWSQWLEQLLAPTRGTRLGQIAVVGATAAIFLFGATDAFTRARNCGLVPRFGAGHHLITCCA